LGRYASKNWGCKVEIDPLTDQEMYEMIEKGLRGGMCQVSHKEAKTINKYMMMDDYDENRPSNYINYLDAKNLYGLAMSMMVAWQTMTGGDEGPSNGRIESEVQQVKRRLRMLVRESCLGERFWPGIARYVGRERLQSQLQTQGVPTKPLLPIGSKVTVKTKRWHRIGQGPLVPPFITMHHSLL